jgi:dynein heavy chain
MWRVFQGMCSAHPKFTPEGVDLVRIWYHENMRVYHDRLTTEEDRKYMKDLLASYFSLFGFEKEQVINVERLIYGDFTQGRDNDNKVYMQIEDLSSLISKMDSYQ